MASNLKLQQLQWRSFRTQGYGKKKDKCNQIVHLNMSMLCPGFCLKTYT